MAKTNNTRKYPDGFGKRPDLTHLKKLDAKERQEHYDSLTIEQKIEKLDAKLGKGLGAKKQRAQLVSMSNTKNVVADTTNVSDIVEEKVSKTKAKERRKNEQK
jgi:hypothetical protein